MGKIVMIAVLIALGLFGVYVMNNNLDKPKPAIENVTLNLSSASPSSTQNQTSNLTPSTIDNVSNSMTAVIKTDKGNLELTLYSKDAPKTVQNFVQKARSGFYAGKIFHRVEDWVIQGGDPQGNGKGGGKMATELNSKPFIIGTVGIARGGDINISNDAQFFIVKTDAQSLNGKGLDKFS